MITVLVVEDDDAVRLLTGARLGERYQVLAAADGCAALELLGRQHVDLIVADVQMPGMDGYTLLQTLRQNGDETPAIFLTAMNTFQHKKQGFACGADDYITKPIDYEELFWRIEAVLRRARITTENRITVGTLTLDQREFTASHNGCPLELTKKEFLLLYKLLSYPGVVFTKQQLMDEIWGYDCEAEYDTIKTYISRLRAKLSDCPEVQLAALRGLGYKAVLTKGEQP